MQVDTEPTTKSKTNGSASNGSRLPEGWHSWPTARVVAKRLRCSRQQVYKLQRDGELRGVDGFTDGKRIRRFDPEQVRALEPLDADELDDDDDELELEDDRPDLAVMKLAAKMVAEARQMSADARKAVHDAYSTTNTPARELLKLAVEALGEREKRIGELEKTVSSMHDEQRDARREDREFSLFQRQVEREDERKAQFWKVASEHGPVVLGQVLDSIKNAGGPLAEWAKHQSPEKQKKLIMAIEAVIGDDEPPGGSPESEHANTTHP